MSIAARLFLALVALAIVAGGVVIFYVLPQLEAPETVASSAAPPGPKPETIVAATPAPVAPPTDSGVAPPAPPAAPAPPPDQVPPPQDPAPQPPPDQPPPAPSPGPGAPIPLAPGSSVPGPAAPGDTAAAAAFDPALPGIGNIAATVNQTLVMAGTADARTEPRADAPVLLRLGKGDPILVSAVMAGRLWLQVELPDHRGAFIPAAALPQAVAGASPGNAPAEAVAPPPQSAMAPSFMADAQTLTLTARTPIYPAPDPAAAVQGVLPAGTQVQIVAKTTDGQWGWLKTADGSPAYIRLGGAAPVAPAAPLPDLVTGRVKVLTTASLVVGGQRVSLYGIKGLGGAYVPFLRALIDQHGGIVTCTRRDTRYVCSLPGNIDIARAALYNGGATLGDDASPEYREQAAAARNSRIGIWAH